MILFKKLKRLESNSIAKFIGIRTAVKFGVLEIHVPFA